MNKRVTETVKRYLSEGYEFYLGNNAHGSQSREEFALHLTNDNGKTVLKIYGTVKHGENWTTQELHVIAEKFKNDKTQDKIFWNGQGEKLGEKVYYIYETTKWSGKKLYIEDKEEYDRLTQIKLQRRKANEENKTVELKSEKSKKIALKLLKKKRGYKSTKLKEIIMVARRHGQYAVYLDGMGWISIK